jgi:hypothetical protein
MLLALLALLFVSTEAGARPYLQCRQANGIVFARRPPSASHALSFCSQYSSAAAFVSSSPLL